MDVPTAIPGTGNWLGGEGLADDISTPAPCEIWREDELKASGDVQKRNRLRI